MDSVKLFYSYSQKDEALRDELENSLSMLKRFDGLNEWHFRKILPGKNIDYEIKKELENSDIILLLLSRSFLASSYCFDVEVKKAMELHENGNAIVIPIILKECDWLHENSPFKSLEGLPRNILPVNKWEDIDSAFNDITQRLKETIKEVKQKRLSIIEAEVNENKKNDAVEGDDNNDDTLEKAFKLISQQTKKLDYNSSKEEFEEVQKIRVKLYAELIGKLDEKIENIPSLKNQVTITLFDKIYSSDKLDNITIQDIQNIRDKKDIYNWYERKVIINSLTLSLISSKIFDPRKVNLLIDFLTDFEEHVWESALIGLVISLVFNQNKWVRFNDLKTRLQTLQEIERVQEGLSVIEIIFRFKLYSKSKFDEAIYRFPFFNLPINCFMPFYDGNLVLENAILNNNSDIDPDQFIEYINNLPLLDSHKYALSLSLESNNIAIKTLNNKERAFLFECLNLSSNFSPYQNLVCEYYNFLNFYPKITLSNIFTKHFSIVRTKLKDLILNKINELELTADIFMDESNFREAITKLTQLIQIEPNNISANSKIATCYSNLKKPDYHSALVHYKKAEELAPNDSRILINIVKSYIAIKDFNNAYTYISKAKVDYSKNKSTILVECEYYDKINDFENVINAGKRGEKLYEFEYLFPLNIGEAYDDLSRYEESIPYLLKAIELVPANNLPNCYQALSGTYLYTPKIDEALDFAKKAYEKDPKDEDSIITLGRTYLLSNKDKVLARKYLELALSKTDKPVLFGNMGHLELIEGNINKSVEFYKKCIIGLNDSKDFLKKIDKDLELMLRCGVSEKLYSKIKFDIVEFYDKMQS
jgi:tetratricopeptide (TPR) repeat protein